ncbi:MAG: histidine kinase, partial [Moraxellaceae bacterium]
MNSFKRNLLIGYICSLILLVLSAGASYISIRNLLGAQDLVKRNTEVISNLDRILSILKDAETGQRGFLITDNEEFLDSYKGSHEKLLTTVGRTRTMLSNDPLQQERLKVLEQTLLRRLNYLGLLINTKQRGEPVTDSLMLVGKSMMDNARILVANMEEREQQLLDEHTNTMNKFASATPVLILGASLLGILITLVSFYKVNSDFDKRAALQQELLEKDKDITKRIIAIEGIATKISAGDYKVRANDEDKDTLGSLAISLNKMAYSLDESFDALSQKEWLQTGLARLNEIMIGEKDLNVLSHAVIEFLTDYTSSQVGAFYLVKDQTMLALMASIALEKSKVNPEVAIGEGMVGRSAASGKAVYMNDIKGTDMLLDCTVGT